MRKINLLTELQVKNAKPDKGKFVTRLPDGGNLYLQVTKSLYEGFNRNWIFRYELDGKRHDLGLGPAHTVGLKQARAKAADLRLQIYDGIDPATERAELKAERLAKKAAERKVMTFAQCAEQYIRIHAPTWKTVKHRKIWESTLRTYALPVIGKLDVADIESGHIAKVLTPIWADKTVTAKRVANRIELVLNYAIAYGFRKAETGNPAARKLINSMLGKVKVQSEHHDALPFVELPQFMIELRKRDLTSARALEFTILCATRTDETLDAVWSEFDLAKKVWTIPAERMKAGREHRIPLSNRAVEVLRSLPRHGSHVFMNGKTRFHKGTLHKLLKKLAPHATVHGMRSSFRDWAEERTSYPEPVKEQALAHHVGDAVVKAYRRTDLFTKRVHLMQDWATFLSKPTTSGDVHDLGAERARRM